MEAAGGRATICQGLLGLGALYEFCRGHWKESPCRRHTVVSWAQGLSGFLTCAEVAFKVTSMYETFIPPGSILEKRKAGGQRVEGTMSQTLRAEDQPLIDSPPKSLTNHSSLKSGDRDEHPASSEKSQLEPATVASEREGADCVCKRNRGLWRTYSAGPEQDRCAQVSLSGTTASNQKPETLSGPALFSLRLAGHVCGQGARGQLGLTRSYSFGILSSRVRRPWLLERMRLICCRGRSWMMRSTESLPSRTRTCPGCRCTSTGRQGSLRPCHSNAGERQGWVSWRLRACPARGTSEGRRPAQSWS